MDSTQAKVGKKSEIPLFGQILDLIPKSILDRNIDNFSSDKHCSTYKTRDQLASMLFGQLKKCLSLREITIGLVTTPEFTQDIGLL